MSEPIQVTVITPCRNEAGHIRAFLTCLARQKTDGLTCEFIIADGMSSDGTREILACEGRRIPVLRVIDNPRRIVSTGLNEAIGQARGEVIVRMDVHSEYADDYVLACVTALIETGADNVGGAMRNVAKTYWGRAIAAAFHSPFSSGGAHFHRDDHEGWVDTVPYGCWRKETLQRLGLFDESMVRNQDDELNLRLTRAGGRIWQSSQIVLWYRPRTSLRSLFRQYFQYGFWKVQVIRKHRIPASWRHLAPGAFVCWLLLAPCLAASLSHSNFGRVLAGCWCLSLAAYFGTCIAASVITARKRGLELLVALPPVFITYHFAYGIGFLAGCLYGRRAAEEKPTTGLFASSAR